ncbi:MAG: hypothetical protein NHF89_00990 [Candidatus Shikimatogenerans bostrichidophilus]|nr:MAG: hypothetical protein NHF89_00990 [Candidatus Shikimatogenerans bostrichidophilus]
MKNNYIQKIIELRKITKFSIKLCKESLKKTKWNIKKSIKYLKNNELKKKYNEKLYNGIVYSKINKNKNIGVIIKVKTESDFITKNINFIILLKKIINISFNCVNIKEILNTKINNNKSVIEEILENKLMFKENIIIYDFVKIKTDYVNCYNHHNNKFSSIVGIKYKKKYIKVKNKIIKNITKNIAIDIIANNNLYKKKNINKYYNNKKIDIFFLKRINITLEEYLNIFKKYIYIYDFNFLKI